eukprot:11049235-Heterocapsa_arctica.AAC.1
MEFPNAEPVHPSMRLSGGRGLQRISGMQRAFTMPLRMRAPATASPGASVPGRSWRSVSRLTTPASGRAARPR